MDTNYVRTTVSLPEEILYEVKKRALMERKTIKEIINEGISKYIGMPITAIPTSNISSLFGSWGKGLSGSNYLKKIRYSQIEKRRESYLKKIWKKS